MNRIGVITNPRSRRNQGRLPAIRQVLSRHPATVHREIAGKLDAIDILREFARWEVDLIVIGGGDGTVQSVMTAILNERMFDSQPALAVLPAGMSNLTAENVGLRGSPEAGLARLLALAAADRPAPRVARRVLSVRQANWEQPAHGMMFGTAAFYRGVMLGYDRIHPLGASRWFADGVTLAITLVQTMAGRSGPNSVFQGYRMAISIDGRALPAQDYILVMATTLERLNFGINPFWGEGEGAVRFTSVTFPPRRFLQAIFPLLRGRPRGWMPEQGYVSQKGHEISLMTDCPIVLDGEILAADARHPMIIRADESFEFVQC